MILSSVIEVSINDLIIRIIIRGWSFKSWCCDASFLDNGDDYQHNNNSADLLIDNGGDGEAVEAVREGFPDLGALAPLAWIKETFETHLLQHI